MTPDLEALSREIAATSDAWMVPGVRMLLDGHRAVRIVMPGRIWVEETGQHIGYEPFAGDLPDLADPVTVNSLLGTGEAHWDATKTYWVATIGKGDASCPTRTHAICRAWIAANREKP